MSEYNPKQKSLGGRGKVVLDLSNSATKADLKTAAGAERHRLLKRLIQLI